MSNPDPKEEERNKSILTPEAEESMLFHLLLWKKKRKNTEGTQCPAIHENQEGDVAT